MSVLVNHFYKFGEFTVDTEQKVLLRADKPLHLAPKVFDTLLILVTHHQRIVEKEELMKRLWPDTFVEEANLTFNIKQLRKTLGDHAHQPIYIETVARRGYRFIAEVEEILSNPRGTGGARVQRFETAPVHSAAADSGFKRAPAALPRVSRRSIALAVGVIIALSGAGLVYRTFSPPPPAGLSANDKAAGKARLAAPLKLEKLTGTGQSRYVAISPDGKYIAYTRALKDKVSLWLRQLATNTNVEIVLPGSSIYGLAFAPNGEYLYFARSEPNALYRVLPLGGVPVKIVENLESNFSISADGQQIAFIRQTNNHDGQREYSLLIARTDGTGERRLLVSMHPERLGVPVWSRDGSAIICAQGNSDGGSQQVRLIEVKLANGMKKELLSERFFYISKLAWLPGRSGLLLSARKNLEDNNQLWRIAYPNMEMRQITEDLIDYLDLSVASGADKAVASQVICLFDLWVGSSREPQNLKKITQARDAFCWTPSGRLIYSSTASGNIDLWSMQPDGTEQRQLTNDPAVDVAPAVTPDNRYIVFMSNRSGSLQVWRMNLDGSNQIQLTQGAAKNYPVISPDGKWALYNTTDNWHLWKVSIDGGEPVRLTEYIGARPSISPDGKLIACFGRTAAKHELLLLPIEGGQPWKKFELADWGSRLRWSTDGQALIYAAELSGETALVKQPLGGGRPQRIVGFGEDELFDFGYSFDGQFLAVTRGNWQHDLVLISELKRLQDW